MQKWVWLARFLVAPTVLYGAIALYYTYCPKTKLVEVKVIRKRVIQNSRGPSGPVLRVNESGHLYDSFVSKIVYDNCEPGDALEISKSLLSQWRTVRISRNERPTETFELNSDSSELIKELIVMSFFLFLPWGAFYIPIPIPKSPRINAYHFGLLALLLFESVTLIFLIRIWYHPFGAF